MKPFLSLIGELLTSLPPNARRFIIGYSVALALLATLDAASLGLLAITVTPLATGSAVNLPLIGEVEGAGIFWIIAAVSFLVLIKGVLSVAFLWIATRRFAQFELAIGSRLFDTFVESSWVDRLKRNSAELVRLVDGSVNATIANVLLPGATLLGEAMTFITVVVVLAIAQPVVAAIALVYLGLIGAVLFFWVTKRSRRAGRVGLKYSLKVSRLITEMVGALKEVTLRNKAGEVAEVVRENRVHSTRARANVRFLGQLPRYVLETAIVGGFVLVGAAGYLLGGVSEALTSVALFSLAGFRMAPSIVRFQSVVSQVTANLPHAQRVVDEIKRSEATRLRLVDRNTRDLPENPQRLGLQEVEFRYEDDVPAALRGITIDIPFGSTVAIVGASGAGKSTLVDLLLGLIEPTNGSISIDGVPLEELTVAWRSRVGYVPQDVALFDNTIAQNVALSWKGGVDRERVKRALAQAQLLSTVEGREKGIDTEVGERGIRLSGGQRQRLGIARALYADPLVLVMDEATSALDTATEAAVTDAIKTLRGSMTIITVAHRLSTVMHSDQIFFMSEGRVEAQGTFQELIAKVPEFAQQANLAGLAPDEEPS